MFTAAALAILAVLAPLVLPAAAGQQQQLILSQGLSLISTCDSEMQIVMCGQIPFTSIYGRRSCCEAYKPVPAEQIAAASAAVTAAVQAVPAVSVQRDAAVLQISPSSVNFGPAMRTDLVRAQVSAQNLSYHLGSCLPEAQVLVPSFYYQESDRSTLLGTSFHRVPLLSSSVISAVKSSANLRWPWALRAAYARIARRDSRSGFLHPAGYAGPAELALMQYRLGVAAQIQQTTQRQGPLKPEAAAMEDPQQQRSPVTEAALYSLVSGANVPPKVYPGPWWPPVDCPASGFTGPYPMSKVEARYGGTDADANICSFNYPRKAPPASCAHVSFVELDAQMSYKQALAYWATGNPGHAETAMRILDGWASKNMDWGLREENGPLEAAWGCAAMSRAMELLKSSRWSGFSSYSYSKFVYWINRVLMPQMDYYVDVITPRSLQLGIQNVHGNWHSTISDCYVSFGLLTDDRFRYQKGLELHRTTLQSYLRWGRSSSQDGRIIGEATETLRDIYHTEFGLGGLIQVAEAAWHQNEDLYSIGEHALAAAVELHARIINANNHTAQLPPGFKFYKSMPKPPAGSAWQFDIRTQLWHAKDLMSGEVLKTQDDGVKYLVGSKWLPTAWEIAYNHFVGRLGMQLPETAKLLRRNWPEHYEFHWGLGTLTHADSATLLWQLGVSDSTVCGFNG